MSPCWEERWHSFVCRVCWDWVYLTLWAFKGVLAHLIYPEIKPVFRSLYRKNSISSRPEGHLHDYRKYAFIIIIILYPLPIILMMGPGLHWLQMSQCFQQNEHCNGRKSLNFDCGQDVACAAGFHSHKGKTIICQSALSVRWTICLWAYWKV